MNYNSDEKDDHVSLCCVLCLCCVLSHFMSISSLHVVNIFLTQLNNPSFSVLRTKRKQTLQLCKTNISTLLCESFKQKQIYEIFPAVGVLLPHTVLHSWPGRGEQS